MSAVHLEIAGGIATLRLDNPARLNAFTPAMLEQLAAHCETLDRDGAVRAVLLTAEGERAFCAGADMNLLGGLQDLVFGSTGPRGGQYDGLVQNVVKGEMRRMGRELVRGVLGGLIGGMKR